MPLGLLRCCQSEDREHPALPVPVAHPKDDMIDGRISSITVEEKVPEELQSRQNASSNKALFT